MSNLLILCIGIPGSGKSTWAAKYLDEHKATVVISTDKLREELFGSAACNPVQNPLVHAEARRRARKALEEKKDVLIDSTNVDLSEWLAYKQISLPSTLRVAKVFNITPTDAMQRMRDRERKVPYDVVLVKWQTLQNNMQFLPYIFNFII